MGHVDGPKNFLVFINPEMPSPAFLFGGKIED